MNAVPQNSSTSVELPLRVQVAAIVSSRYQPSHVRPLSWDERTEGIDVIRTTDGRTVRLLSDGQQSPPQPHWVILLRSGDEQGGFRWTLYAMPPER